MSKKTLPLSQVYRWIETGPAVLVTTSLLGKHNSMAMTWHMMIDFEPPLIGCVISNRNYTFQILRKTQECVINIPSKDMIDQVIQVGNISGEKVDKFHQFQLEEEKARYVQAPLLSQCFINLECKVIDQKMAQKYNLFIVKVLKAWIRPHLQMQMIHHFGKGWFIVDGKKVHKKSMKQ